MPTRLSDLVRKLLTRPRRLTATPPPRTVLALTPLEDRVVPTAVVTIAATANGTEGGGAVTYQLTRTDTTGNLTVGLTVDAAAPIDGAAVADAGTDYTAPTSAMFTSGQATVTVTITPANDTDSEPTEAITLVVNNGFGYSVGSPDSATGYIFDNDAQVVSVANGDAREGGADGAFVLTRTGDLSGSLTVNYTAGGTATSGTDYTSIGTSVTFAADSATAEVAVTAADDSGTYDPDETVTLTVGTGTGYSVGSPSSATVTIEDNALGTFTLASTAGQIWYDIPWGSVDPDEATQSVSLSNFKLVFNGQTFTTGNSTFTVTPTAEFEYGDLVNIKFTVSFASAVAGLSSLGLDGGVVTGIVAVTQTPTTTTLQDNTPHSITLDFNTITIPPATGNPYTIKIAWTAANTMNPQEVQITIEAGSSAGAVRDSVAVALKGVGLGIKEGGDTRLTIQGPAGKALQSVTLVSRLVGTTGPKLAASSAPNPGVAPTYTFVNN